MGKKKYTGYENKTTAVSYRKVIQAIVGSANKSKSNFEKSIPYDVLVEWLREQDLRLDIDLFKAILHICQDMIDDEKLGIDKACRAYEMFVHTGTNVDEIHTDYKIYKAYVEKVLPLIIARIEESKEMVIDDDLRLRSVDVVKIGRLFDNILNIVSDDNKMQVEKMMNNFMADI